MNGVRVRHAARNLLVRAGGAVRFVGGAVPGKRAITFHEVGNEPQFRDRLDWLLDQYQVLPMREWLDGPVEDRTQITLTFDDGYASWHEWVALALEERGMSAVFFVSSGLVGLAGNRAARFARDCLRRRRSVRFLTPSQLRELAAHGLFEIGGHTVHHVNLGAATGKSIRTEILEDRERLEEWTGGPIRLFAYPFGTPANLSVAARDVLSEVGFDAAFTLVPGTWNPRQGDRLAIPRNGLELGYSDAVWRAWLSGGYDTLYRAKFAALRAFRRADKSQYVT